MKASNYEEWRISEIKKNGKLFALDGDFQLWIQNETVYSFRADHSGYSMWCPHSMLARHLKKLYRITGKRFEDWEDVCIIHPEFLPEY